MQVQEATKKETLHIAVGVLGFSAIMNLVFLCLKKWELSVLWGTLMGGGWAILNFFLLGLTVQKMVADPDEKRGKRLLQRSYTLRMLCTIVVTAVALRLPGVNGVAEVVPLFFPRLTILAMQLLGMYKPEEKGTDENGEGGDGTV
ncbi:MAG: ATP synthase subunit I [Oscillospiraceae bacterium]|nr:ATP synthase subunit I [Oscillospiraceae bacterium]